VTCISAFLFDATRAAFLAQSHGQTNNGVPFWTTAAAITGAVTGTAAFLWNVWRDVTEGARLHIAFYAYEEQRQGQTNQAAAVVSAANAGRVDAHVQSIGVTNDRPPWTERWPIVRSTSFRTRVRWLRWLYHGRGMRIELIPLEPDITGTLHPGEKRVGRLGKLERRGLPADDNPWSFVPLDHDAVLELLNDRRWAIVETGLRWYCVPLVDERRGA
jgi:hypothetical protein